MPAMIVMGDKTDHGGEVIECSEITDTNGRRIARVGDKVSCPKKGHGTTVIVTGDDTMLIDGKAVAYHGCRTSCGAKLISSQSATGVELSGGWSGARSDSVSSPVTQSVLYGSHQGGYVRAHPVFDLHFLLKDEETGAPLFGIPYRITLDTGEEFLGQTDAGGLTQIVSSGEQRVACLEAPYYGQINSNSHADNGYDACGC
ncbi:hypothetical protein CLD22_21585 [Rubrivivax gelatinosus]|nr:hypothetical protein [Rubrivivax gelatinosus]